MPSILIPLDEVTYKALERIHDATQQIIRLYDNLSLPPPPRVVPVCEYPRLWDIFVEHLAHPDELGVFGAFPSVDIVTA